MNKRIAVLLSMIILSAALYGEIELGLSYTPGSFLKTEETIALEELSGNDANQDDSILGFHVGYSFWWLFYVSFDSLVVPSWWVQQTTSYTDSDGYYNAGTKAPGYINFIDVGVRPKIGPVYLLATLGLNTLYIHSDYVTGDEDTELGVNMRLGVGVVFEPFSISLTTTSVYSNFDQLQSTVIGLAEGSESSIDDFVQSLIPTLGFVIHFK